jgi:hypothetical protein
MGRHTHWSELVFAFRHGWMLLAGGLGGATACLVAASRAPDSYWRSRLAWLALLIGGGAVLAFALYYWSL